ncbi:MAG: hypothetical protein SGJ15_14860 [Bacteroidota bacterium]|nr:hypothetical protein [Bacteroidota bacterium]
MKKLLQIGSTFLLALSCYSQNSSSANSSHSPIISSVFTKISGSMNVYGAYISNAKPLQYNRYVNAFSFIQRKSQTYITNPTLSSYAQSGAVVMYIGKNDGSSWDSTLIYSHNNNWGRYPTGGLYVPLNATSVSQAYAVGSGACSSSGGLWVGSWRASKLVGSVGTNSVGSDMQFFANTGSYSSATSPAMTKHHSPS